MDLWFETALLPTGWAERVTVRIAEGRIAQVLMGTDPAPGAGRHRAAVPGLGNVHSHGFQRGMAGLSERRGRPDDDFWSWREIMYRFLDRLTPEDITAITALAYAEMLETGYTRVGEFHYLHNDVDGARYADPAETAGAIVAAAGQTGIGLTLLPVFYAHRGSRQSERWRPAGDGTSCRSHLPRPARLLPRCPPTRCSVSHRIRCARSRRRNCWRSPR